MKPFECLYNLVDAHRYLMVLVVDCGVGLLVSINNAKALGTWSAKALYVMKPQTVNVQTDSYQHMNKCRRAAAALFVRVSSYSAIPEWQCAVCRRLCCKAAL